MKIIKHTIGGQERTLDFGKMWFLKFFGEASGSDPMNLGEMANDTKKQFDFIVALVYGGVMCHNKSVKNGEVVTVAEVIDWVGSLEDKEAAEIINKFATATIVPAGEA